ncbi:MAG: YpdA family putative bacillithiol disulfide reductase [Saprospiraceae bacterium]
MFDTIIIGAGPIGLACGIEAKKRGLSYLIIEKGCLVNSIFNYPANMRFFSTSDKIEIGNIPFVSINNKPTREEALEYYRRVKNYWKLDVNLYEEVTDVKTENDLFHITTSKRKYESKTVVIATGFYDVPNSLGVEGEYLTKVKYYYDNPHRYIDQNVVVVGAANSACDAALECWRKGANVTMVIRKSTINRRVKYWIKPDIENRIKEGSIKAYFESTVEKITENQVVIKTQEESVTIENDFVLALIGYHPNFDWLSKIGLEFSEDSMRIPCYDEHSYETNVPNIFIAGVVCGGRITNRWFIENARFHAERAVNEIEKKLLK